MRTYLESVEDRMATLEHDPDGGSLYLAVRALGAMETALREMVRENDALQARVAALEARLRGLDAERSRLSDALMEVGCVLAEAGRNLGPGGDA